jgi:ComF family protein
VVDGCRDCPPPAVSWSRSAFLYEGPVRRALMRLKFSGWRAEADTFAPWMALVLGHAPPEAVVTWVPLGRRRKRRRGFDQAEALARALARRTGRPVRRLLERRAETAPQARRTGFERRLALRGAFRATGAAPPVVILVDDVLTSGSTAAACAETLRGAGAERVLVLSAARALGSGVPRRCYGRIGPPACAGSSRRV